MRKKWKMIAIVASVAVGALAVVGVASATSTPTTVPDSSDACTALRDNPEAAAELAALRSAKQEAWQAWFATYDTAAERSSDEAQAEKQQLRDQYHSDMTALLEKHGIDASECTPGSRSGAENGRGLMMGGGMGNHGTGKGTCLN